MTWAKNPDALLQGLSPTNMNSSILPNAQTRQPSRAGLVHYEILADGLIHAATVFGFAPDDDFVPRVTALAFLNGIQVVTHHPKDAGRIAGLISQTLEAGPNAHLSFCQKTEAELNNPDGPLAAAAAMARRHFGVLEVGDPAAANLIRSLVAGAVASGIYARSLAPTLYQTSLKAIEGQVNEQAFLLNRLCWWGSSEGLPTDHPFIDLAARMYNSRPLERDLLCPMFHDRLKKVLNKENPWALEEWLQAGWQEGRLTARFAPDLVAPVLAELDPRERERNLELYQGHLVRSNGSNDRELLLAGFEAFAREVYPKGLGDEELRRLNPRLTIVNAYDYAVWMGIVAETDAKTVMATATKPHAHS